jgi:hypothetical protein
LVVNEIVEVSVTGALCVLPATTTVEKLTGQVVVMMTVSKVL